MSEQAARKSRPYTWTDYQSWPSDERWEIISGDAFAMSPGPSLRHQSVSRELLISLTDYYRGKPCEVLSAPIDVKLTAADIVQPDIIVVCDSRQLQKTHIDGAPSLVIEIISRSTEVHDRHDKMRLYARSGVKEYWIVTPYPSLVEVYMLEGDGYRVESVYKKDETLTSPQFPDLTLDLSSIFIFPLEPDEKRSEEARQPPDHSASTNQ